MACQRRPRSVAGALFEELDGLAPPARALLDAGAIAGDPFEPELAYAIAELDPDAGVAALDELLDDPPAAADERAAAVRVPASARAPSRLRVDRRRLAAHRPRPRGRGAGGARGGAAASRAHHVEQSAAQGDEEAIATLLEAGRSDRAARPGHRGALVRRRPAAAARARRGRPRPDARRAGAGAARGRRQRRAARRAWPRR